MCIEEGKVVKGVKKILCLYLLFPPLCGNKQYVSKSI